MSAYRWYYTDLSTAELSVVVIFMMRAPVFSARSLGAALNVAVYERGRRRHWVFTDYTAAEEDGECLRIGRSCLRRVGRQIHIDVDDNEASGGASLRLALRLQATGPKGPELCLQASHRWQALMPRAHGSLSIAGKVHEGFGYHDTNWGDEPLRTAWTWSREHRADETIVRYFLRGQETGSVLRASADACTLRETATPRETRRRSRWGLLVPTQAGEMIESSPFYARLLARQGVDRITEVADFGRFSSPWCRWMPYFRSRRAESA